MIIGVPKEIKLQEHRIGLTPDSVKVLSQKGHEVLIQESGGFEAGFTNEDYLSSGAKIIKDSNSGFVSNSENINDFVNSIISFDKLSDYKRQEFGLNGRKYFEKEFERSKLLKRLIDIFEQ